MVEYVESSQLHAWMFASVEQLDQCRGRANYEARELLAEVSAPEGVAGSDQNSKSSYIMAKSFACGFNQRVADGTEPSRLYGNEGAQESKTGHPFLSPDEEATLVTFYACKISSLIGPKAFISRLRRESKVTATAALLFRRFYLSNSVMIFDPKAVMVAAAFLASKVEDATADVRYLEEGTQAMNAPVTLSEIIPNELNLLQGCHFDLLCFHPFKAALALTEDLRTFLKSDKGQSLVERPISGQDLKPMYDKAREILEDYLCSDLPLIYTPGQVGLASLIVAQDLIFEESQVNVTGGSGTTTMPRIDFEGYIQARFVDISATKRESTTKRLIDLASMLKRLKQGDFGCGHYQTDMTKLKGIHKKLKKVRVWGTSSSKDSKKRSAPTTTEEEKPQSHKSAKTS